MDVRTILIGFSAAILFACGTASNVPLDAGNDVADAANDVGGQLDAPSTTATATTCSTWLAAQRETNLPSTSGSNAVKRADLLTAGGGYRKIDDTYYAAWFPAAHFDKSKRRIIFVLHGTKGAPEYEFADWKPSFDPRGYAFIGLKWYYEGKQAPDDYSNGETLYQRMTAILDEMDGPCGTKTANVSLLGFSRGSAQAFEVLARDRAGQQRIKSVVAVSGAWPTTMKPTDYLAALDTKGDTTAMTGGRMWMYCGGQDMDLGEPMCDILRNAKSWVERHGGTVQKLYENPSGGHHSMTDTPEALTDAFDYVDSL